MNAEEPTYAAVALLQAYVNRLPTDKKLRVLEVGATPESLSELKHFLKDREIEIVGVSLDTFSERRLSLLKETGIKHLRQNLLNLTPDEVGKFDFIISNRVMSTHGISSSVGDVLSEIGMSPMLAYTADRELFKETIHFMHDTIFDLLKEGGMAIHCVDVHEQIVHPANDRFHLVFSEPHKLVLTKPSLEA